MQSFSAERNHFVNIIVKIIFLLSHLFFPITMSTCRQVGAPYSITKKTNKKLFCTTVFISTNDISKCF